MKRITINSDRTIEETENPPPPPPRKPIWSIEELASISGQPQAKVKDHICKGILKPTDHFNATQWLIYWTTGIMVIEVAGEFQPINLKDIWDAILKEEEFIQIAYTEPGARIHYTTNGNKPTTKSKLYTHPFQFNFQPHPSKLTMRKPIWSIQELANLIHSNRETVRREIRYGRLHPKDHLKTTRWLLKKI